MPNRRIHCIGELGDNNIDASTTTMTLSSVWLAEVGVGTVSWELLEVFCGGATVAVDHFLRESQWY